VKLHFTSGYHLEGNGQTEHTNQTLEQYLQAYCNYQQDNWSELLPLAEFAYNNAPSATMGIFSFYANKGYHLNLSVQPERDLTLARACEYAVDLDKLHTELQTQSAAAQECYQRSADACRSPAPDFKVGDHAFVKAAFFWTARPSRKLSKKNLGPFEIIAQVGTHSFTLWLPDSMRVVHLVFHVSMLEPATPNTISGRIPPPPPPMAIDGEPEFEIAEILDSKVDNQCRLCKLLYLVRWSGYEGMDEETSWVLAMELGNASEVVVDFHTSYPNKPGPWENLWLISFVTLFRLQHKTSIRFKKKKTRQGGRQGSKKGSLGQLQAHSALMAPSNPNLFHLRVTHNSCNSRFSCNSRISHNSQPNSQRLHLV
jgi:hypothetical protein